MCEAQGPGEAPMEGNITLPQRQHSCAATVTAGSSPAGQRAEPAVRWRQARPEARCSASRMRAQCSSVRQGCSCAERTMLLIMPLRSGMAPELAANAREVIQKVACGG